MALDHMEKSAKADVRKARKDSVGRILAVGQG